MKKLTVLVLLAMVLATNTRADSAWTLGVKGGVSIATAGGDDTDEEDIGSRTAFVGGAFGQFDLSKNLGIRFEGLYFMKGATAEAGAFDGAFELDYIEFPVLLVGQAPVSKAVTLNAFAGPSFSINTSANASVDFGGFEYSDNIGQDISDFDIGLTFGAGATFAAGSVMIVLDGRYDLGLMTFDDGLQSGNELDLKNQAWAFMAGVGFPLN